MVQSFTMEIPSQVSPMLEYDWARGIRRIPIPRQSSEHDWIAHRKEPGETDYVREPGTVKKMTRATQIGGHMLFRKFLTVNKTNYTIERALLQRIRLDSWFHFIAYSSKVIFN